MEQREMVELIRGGVPAPGGVWADLGCGTGNFTWALAELLGEGATVHALDRDQRAVRAVEARLAADPPAAAVLPRQAEAERLPQLPPLDGILAANLLHFVRAQGPLLTALAGRLRPGGRLLVVEYDQRLPIPWVPFPLPPDRLGDLARAAGLAEYREVGRRTSPSSGRAMYAAAAVRASSSAE